MGGLDVGNTPSTNTYVVNGCNKMLSASDPRSVGYDVESRFGRGRAEREQRKRKQNEQEERFSSLQAPVTRSVPEITAPHRDAGNSLEAKFFAEVDQNSLAAKTLRMAQATLRGEAGIQPNTSSTERCDDLSNSTSTSRLLARHKASSSTLPKAQLRSKKVRPSLPDGKDPNSDGYVII